MNPEPPEERPPGEPIRCRHCGKTFEPDEDGVDFGDHEDGCPQNRAEEHPDVPNTERTDMIIPERDGDLDEG